MTIINTAAVVGHNGLNANCQKSFSQRFHMGVFKATGDNEARDFIDLCRNIDFKNWHENLM